MAPTQYKKIKRTVKFLSQCHDPKVVSLILRKADNSLVKGICNAALNLSKGEVPLSTKKKRYFAHHRKFIDTLTSPKVGLARKRAIIQKGGAFGAIIPILLSTVLGTLGSAIFHKRDE